MYVVVGASIGKCFARLLVSNPSCPFQILKYRIWPERKPGEPEPMFAALMKAFLYDPQQRPTIAELLRNFRTFQSELRDSSSELGKMIRQT